MKLERSIRQGLALLLATVASFAGNAAEQKPAAAYPSKPIRFLVPYPAGGGTDLFARLVGRKLSEQTGQPVVIDNRPGATGIIAGAAVSQAAPDGYTILVDQSSIATNQLLYKKLPFDLKRDLTPVLLGAKLDNAFLVNAQSPLRSMADLIALAKSKPGKLAYGSAGVGSAQHLAMELLKKQTDVDLLHVPYKGTPPAVLALQADEIQLLLFSAAAAEPYIKAGKLRAIATTGTKRSAVLPEVPTMVEAGFPDYTNYNWLGIFTRSGTPQAVIDALYSQLSTSLADPAVRDTLGKQGWELVGGPPQALRRQIDEETARFEKLIRDGGMQVDQP